MTKPDTFDDELDNVTWSLPATYEIGAVLADYNRAVCAFRAPLPEVPQDQLWRQHAVALEIERLLDTDDFEAVIAQGRVLTQLKPKMVSTMRTKRALSEIWPILRALGRGPDAGVGNDNVRFKWRSPAGSLVVSYQNDRTPVFVWTAVTGWTDLRGEPIKRALAAALDTLPLGETR